MMYIFLILILFAILFRRQMRGLVTLIGFFLLVTMIYFGCCFYHFEQARGTEIAAKVAIDNMDLK